MMVGGGGGVKNGQRYAHVVYGRTLSKALDDLGRLQVVFNPKFVKKLIWNHLTHVLKNLKTSQKNWFSFKAGKKEDELKR